MEWEVRLIEWLQQTLGGAGTAFGKVFSFLGGETGLLLLMLIVLFCWKKEVGLRLGAVICAVLTWLPMIKSAVLRPRPYMAHPDRIEARELVAADAAADDVAAQGYSFPSMHSASVTSLFFYLGRELRKRWMWITAALFSFLVGISRLIVGMHYPTDVLAGWALGFAGIGIIALLEKKIKKEWIRHRIILLSVLPGLFFVRTHDYFTALGLLIGLFLVIPFERRYVRFQDTRNVWAMILRMAGAFGLYFGLNTLLKLPFSEAFLDGTTMGALLVRTLRYAIDLFVIVGIYPKVFPLFEKVGRKK